MLEISNLEKMEPNRMLITDVSITLHPGEIFALVGEPASGKSLLSRMILTLATRTNGTIKIKGQQLIGAFIQSEQFMPNDTVLTIIKDYCKLHDQYFNLKRAKNILALMNLKNYLHYRVRKLSNSQIDRLKIALPLILQADIILLDAPFDRLNGKEARDLRVLLKKISNEKKTSILVTARHMQDIEEICDTIGIIDDGMMVAIKTYNQMIAKEKDQAKLALTVAQPNYAAKIIETELRLTTHLCGDRVIIDTKPDNVQQIVDLLNNKRVQVLAANRAYRSLEFQYLEIIGNRKKYY